MGMDVLSTAVPAATLGHPQRRSTALPNQVCLGGPRDMKGFRQNGSYPPRGQI
jgi:hypothetical protein